MTKCQHGQSQRQCPLCERDETIAELRQRVQALEFSCSETERERDRIERERDALRAEIHKQRVELTLRHNQETASLRQAYDTLVDTMAKVEGMRSQTIVISDESALRARLAAAERVCVDARRVMKGMEPLDSEDAFTLHDLKSSLAAYDAAKETNTP